MGGGAGGGGRSGALVGVARTDDRAEGFGSPFGSDRLAKYGFGTVRLALLLALLGLSHAAALPTSLGRRLVPYAAFGAAGAAVNSLCLPRAWTAVATAAVFALGIWDFQQGDHTVIVYFLKTALGDLLAGKIDCLEWRAGMAVGVALVGVVCVAVPGLAAFSAAMGAFSRIAPALFAVQLISEYGDNHFEHLTFFRHRYSFEALTALVAAVLWPLAEAEARVTALDLVACLSYRATNAAIIVSKQQARGSTTFIMGVFHALGVAYGFRVHQVSDPALAVAVLQQSTRKGRGLESLIACPAWSPVLSLESVDGEVWEAMAADFQQLLRAVPGKERLVKVARRHLQRAAASREVIDAEEVARLTFAVFIEYLFGREWEPLFQVLVDASWEWRKEIAVRGKASGDVKARAIDLVVNDLIRSSDYWDMHGEAWSQPRYYSLFMQPFLVSPAINTGDLAVAFKSHPDLDVEGAARSMNPFPILERWVESEVPLGGGGGGGAAGGVPAGRHVVMCTDDFIGTSFPVFGAGRRRCAGAHLALPWLTEVRATLLPLGDRFRPDLGHRYSGRNNDSKTSAGEAVYLLCTLLRAFFTTPPGSAVAI